MDQNSRRKSPLFGKISLCSCVALVLILVAPLCVLQIYAPSPEKQPAPDRVPRSSNDWGDNTANSGLEGTITEACKCTAQVERVLAPVSSSALLLWLVIVEASRTNNDRLASAEVALRYRCYRPLSSTGTRGHYRRSKQAPEPS